MMLRRCYFTLPQVDDIKYRKLPVPVDVCNEKHLISENSVCTNVQIFPHSDDSTRIPYWSVYKYRLMCISLDDEKFLFYFSDLNVLQWVSHNIKFYVFL